MRIVEQYYGPVQDFGGVWMTPDGPVYASPWDVVPIRSPKDIPRSSWEYEARMEVEVEGKRYKAQTRIYDGPSKFAAPPEYHFRNLQKMIMDEIEKDLFR